MLFKPFQVAERGVNYTLTKGVHYTLFSDLPMCDWDWDDPIHPAQCVTVTCVQDVLVLLDNYLATHQDYIKMYITPSGVHAFFLGKPRSCLELDWASLKSDPLYEMLAKRIGAFGVRVSAKQRERDFIAEYIITLANCEPDPELVRKLAVHHDRRIAEFRDRDARKWAAEAVVKARV